MTISTWIYQDNESTDNSNIQTIYNKGAEENNDHIWLYTKGDAVYFELGSSNDGYGRREITASMGKDPSTDIDLHLKSQAGRWDHGTWTTDDETSPAIDQAKPSADYSKEPTPNGARANIGAYGNTKEASKSQ